MVSHIHWPNRDNWIWLNILEIVFKCDIIMIFFNLQNWNIHSEGQYIIVCFIDFNVSNGHQHHATIDTSCTPPPLCSQAAEHFLVKLEDEYFPWPSNIHYKPKSFMQKKPMSLILANLKSLHVPEHRFPSIATTCRVSSLSKKVLLNVRKKKVKWATQTYTDSLTFSLSIVRVRDELSPYLDRMKQAVVVILYLAQLQKVETCWRKKVTMPVS